MPDLRPLGPLARLGQLVLAANAAFKLVLLAGVGLALAGRAPAALSAWLSTLDRVAWLFVPLALGLPALLSRRAVINLLGLGERGLSHTPRTAATSFFMPVLQVQLGDAVLQEVWARTAAAAREPKERTRVELGRVSRFWKTLTGGAVVAYVGARLVEVPLVPELGVLLVLGAGLALQLYADVAGLRLLGQLARRHDALLVPGALAT